MYDIKHSLHPKPFSKNNRQLATSQQHKVRLPHILIFTFLYLTFPQGLDLFSSLQDFDQVDVDEWVGQVDMDEWVSQMYEQTGKPDLLQGETSPPHLSPPVPTYPTSPSNHYPTPTSFSEPSTNQSITMRTTDGELVHTISIPFNMTPDVMIGKKSLILKQATSELFNQRENNLANLIDVLVNHKQFRGNVYNLLASFLNIFSSEEALHTFHSKIFKLKIKEIMFNSILTANDFSTFLQEMKCVFIGRDFCELLHKLDDLFDRMLLKLSCKYKASLELNIVFWMLTHLNLSEHLFTLRDLIPGADQSLTFEKLIAKQMDSAKTRGGQLKRENKVF